MKRDGVTVRQYWDLSPPYANIGSLEEAANEVHNLIQEAVTSQIISDVPFGCLLSGGIDSTTVTHFLNSCISKCSKDNNRNTLHTFSLQLREYEQHFQV